MSYAVPAVTRSRNAGRYIPSEFASTAEQFMQAVLVTAVSFVLRDGPNRGRGHVQANGDAQAFTADRTRTIANAMRSRLHKLLSYCVERADWPHASRPRIICCHNIRRTRRSRWKNHIATGCHGTSSYLLGSSRESEFHDADDHAGARSRGYPSRRPSVVTIG